MMTSGQSHQFRWKCRRFSRWTQMIARSAIFLSAFPYNVTRTIGAELSGILPFRLD
jgi:hypothetical protein